VGFDARHAVLGRKTGLTIAFAVQASASGDFSKTYSKTIAYVEILETVACYLCNTHSKTGCLRPFEAVPLLRVQSASVIVNTRRRGASRGRPVIGGSLKSLAFSGCVRRREAARR
jgi:hypothetical protein